jgi:transcription termination/antitermination protein NusA
MSVDERIDPVGACVGMKGVRIHAVVRELGNENIDVLQWSDNPVELIKRSLAPAHPVAVTINDQLNPPRARVEVRADEVSQAIGKGGINIRLASRLVGYEIDVYREIADEEEDIDITEFSDEIPAETIQRLREVGCETARSVMELSPEELSRRSGLGIEDARNVMRIVRSEFEDEEESEVEGEA